jgi:hypothetical protein
LRRDEHVLFAGLSGHGSHLLGYGGIVPLDEGQVIPLETKARTIELTRDGRVESLPRLVETIEGEIAADQVSVSDQVGSEPDCLSRLFGGLFKLPERRVHHPPRLLWAISSFG